jgi:arsenical pump membrane protein
MQPSLLAPAATITVFLMVIFLALQQPRFRLPFLHRPARIDYDVAPILGAAALLAFAFGREAVVDGIRGTAFIRPYSILILFMSLAYICRSLDLTGFFNYLALVAARSAGNSGRRLFIYFFALSSILTVFTSNDIVILTLTPIICYHAKNTNSNPVPYLIAQFFAANIWSMALYIGNPTNIIVAQAYQIRFLEYTTWMGLPTVVAGTACFGLLWLIFRKRISETVQAPAITPQTALTDSQGAIFGATCLGVCVVLLSISQWLPVQIWVIPFAIALVMLCRDIHVYYLSAPKQARFAAGLPALRTLPWKIVPFLIGHFIMVENLSSSGWIGVFAGGLSRVFTRLLPATLGMGFLSACVSNLVNNQPMTILFTRIIGDASFAINGLTRTGSMFALIAGSNLGANLTFMGSLAGLMWVSICADKGVRITWREFTRYGLMVMPAVIALACLTLAMELRLWA